MSAVSGTMTAEKTQQLCALSISENSVSLAHIDYSVGEAKTSHQPRLTFCSYFPYQSLPELSSIIASEVKKYNLQNVACSWVLSPRDYLLLSLDALPVLEDELPTAVQWRVRDLIDYSVEEASINYFPIPQREGHSEQFVYAAVARTVYLSQYAQLIKSCGLHLKIIDVPELALRNIVRLLPEARAGASIALLYFHSAGVKLLLIHQDMIYLIRQINPYAGDKAASSNIIVDSQTLHEGLLSNLLLEIQRSCDYYENELGMVPVSKLYVIPSYHPLMPKLAEQLPFEVESLDVETLLATDFVVAAEMQTHCLTAIGAALRRKRKGDKNQEQEKNAARN